MGVMANVANKLTDDQIKSVAAYYESQGLPQGEDRWALVLGAYTRAAALAFRAAATDGVPLRLWDGIRSLGKLYSITRWLIALELVIMAATIVFAIVKTL